MAKEPKTYPHDSEFPENVNPSEENRRKFSDQREKERKDMEKEAEDAVDADDKKA